MAGLREYAQWIVDNPDKKGTQDYETIAAAFKKLNTERKEALQEDTTALGRGLSRGIDVAGRGFGSALEGLGSGVGTGLDYFLETLGETAPQTGLSLDSVRPCRYHCWWSCWRCLVTNTVLLR
jgi:hypothetical protein